MKCRIVDQSEYTLKILPNAAKRQSSQKGYSREKARKDQSTKTSKRTGEKEEEEHIEGTIQPELTGHGWGLNSNSQERFLTQ